MTIPTFAEAFPAIMTVIVSIAGWATANYIVRHKHDGSKARLPRD